jgi:glycine hydroxymethyltransferase
MLVKPIVKGGHVSMGPERVKGTAGFVSRLDVQYFAFDDERLSIDVDASKRRIKEMAREGRPPKLAMFGGSLILFPEPVKELAPALEEVGATICYDGAHVAGLIAAGLFQDPLREGAHIMTMSTHKTIPGPQGGAIVSDEKRGEVIKGVTFPAAVSNHHLHHVAGKAIAFAEMLAFGREYCERVVRNAKALAQALSERGLDVVGEARGFTESHQVAVDVSRYCLGGEAEARLERANIIVNRQLLYRDIQRGLHYQNPSGIRLGTQEVTRLGMGESEMKEIAELIARVLVKGEEPERVREYVRELRRPYQRVLYCFESQKEAYAYVRLR